MAFCVNCGQPLSQKAKFCPNCGTSVVEDYSQRKIEYVGKVHKCPECGAVLKSFEINCPACGYELRSVKTSSAVKEFALKLEAIEARREYEKPRGLFAMIAASERMSKTDEQKVSLIKSFPVPNSKEDMLEFMILATSSMNMRTYDSTVTDISKGEKEINAAWFAKIQQVYEKAKRSYSSDSIFTEIKGLYSECNQNIRKSKKKGIIKWGLMLGWIPIALIALIIDLSIFEPRNEARELERLDNIVVEVQEALEAGEYQHALRIADSIDYQKYDIEMERKWDIQRAYWVDKVLEEATENGVDLEYIPSEDADRANSVPNQDSSGGGFIEGFKSAAQPDLESLQDGIDAVNNALTSEGTSSGQ